MRSGLGVEGGLQALTCDEWGSGISVRFHGKLSTVMGPLGSPLVNRVECVNVYPKIKMLNFWKLGGDEFDVNCLRLDFWGIK